MDEEYNFSVDDAERETIRVWRTWRTVFEMLQDRVRF
jgi:DNA-directed RNA polymerase I, II, and III subunit RPABC1